MTNCTYCTKEAKAPKGMCWIHYNRQRRYGDVNHERRTPNAMPLHDRLRRFFTEGSLEECWIWQGSRQGVYGSIKWNGAMQRAHREVYKMLVGNIEDETLDHLCRNTLCVNPRHLDPCSRSENSRRQGEATYKTQCKNGHDYSPENTYIDGKGGRSCKECRREALKRHRDKKELLRLS